MSFWNTATQIAKFVGNSIIDKSKEIKEIQENEMASLSDSDLLDARKKGNTTTKLAANREAKERGLL